MLKRDYNRMLELGGNIYFTAKLGATDGHSFQHLAAMMTGSTQEDYAEMMLRGGRTVEGNRSRVRQDKPNGRIEARKESQGETAKIPARESNAVARSSQESPPRTCRPSARRSTIIADRRAVLAARVRRLRELQGVDGQGQAGRRHRRLQRSRLGVLGRHHPDVRARHARPSSRLADEGWGPRPVPVVKGHPRACRAHRAVGDPRRVRPDHRATRWRSITA